jgi:hypothetical protein
MVNTEYACLTTDDLISYVLNKTEDSLLVELAQRLQLASDMLEEADEMEWDSGKHSNGGRSQVFN